MALLSRDASDKIRRATLRRAPAAVAELTPGTRVYFWSPHPMKGRRRQDALRWRGPATVIARESVGRYYVGWRSRVLLVAKDQLRLATAEEATAHEVIGKDMAMTADPKCYQDMTGAPPPARRQPAAAAPVLPPLQDLPRAVRALQDVPNAKQAQEKERKVAEGRRARGAYGSSGSSNTAGFAGVATRDSARDGRVAERWTYFCLKAWYAAG